MYKIGRDVPTNEELEEMFEYKFPLDPSSKKKVCTSIEDFIRLFHNKFKKNELPSPFTIISGDKICQLNSTEEIQAIEKKMIAFLDKGLTVHDKETFGMLSHIYGLIVKHWRGGRKRKTKRRLHFNIHTSKNHFMV